MALQSLSTFEGDLTGTRRSRLDLTGKAYKQPAIYAPDWLNQPCNDALPKRVEHLGDQTRLHLTFKRHDLITVTDAHTPLMGGETIRIQPSQPLYFDAAGMRLA